VLAWAALLAGCMDQDPFGLAERPVAGGVSLEQWEDGETYYLTGFDHDEGGGLVDGTVQRLGWGVALSRSREQLSLNFAIENLANEYYRDHFQFAPARGRSFTVGVSAGTR